MSFLSDRKRVYWYNCDGFDDRGWGCGWRTMQTVSSLLFDEQVSITEIDETLTSMGFATRTQDGSRLAFADLGWISEYFRVKYCSSQSLDSTTTQPAAPQKVYVESSIAASVPVVPPSTSTPPVSASTSSTINHEQEWVRRKNGNAGGSLLKKIRCELSQDSLDGMFETNTHQDRLVAEILFPEVDQSNLPGFLVHNVLSKEECDLLIKQFPHEGKGYLSPAEIRKLYRGRVVHRFMSADKHMSQLLEARLGSLLPPTLDNDSMEFACNSYHFHSRFSPRLPSLSDTLSLYK